MKANRAPSNGNAPLKSTTSNAKSTQPTPAENGPYRAEPRRSQHGDDLLRTARIGSRLSQPLTLRQQREHRGRDREQDGRYADDRDHR